MNDKTPLTDASLALWLTLSRASTDPDPRLDALAMRQLSHPEVDVNAQYQNTSLLTLAARRQSPHGTSFNVPQGPQSFVPTPHHQLALELIRRGANPWQTEGTTMDVGMDPLLAAVDAQAWPVMRALLRQPGRPDWSALLEYQGGHLGANLSSLFRRFPLVLEEMLTQGMDPNTQAHHLPLLFLMPSIEQAEWLVSQGADGKARDGDGRNVLAHRQSQRATEPANEEERERWVALMGRDQVDPAEVFAAGMSGSMSRLRPLFDKKSSMRAWRWDLEADRPLSLADACAWGQILGHHMPQALRDLVATTGDSPSQDLLWLSQLQVPNEPTASAPVSPDRLCDAVRNWVNLDLRLLQHTTLHAPYAGEKFADWVELASDSATREVVLDQWLAWHESDPSRWKNVSSFLRYEARQPSADAVATWPARHRLAWMAHRWQAAVTSAERGPDYSRPAAVRDQAIAEARAHTFGCLVQMFPLKEEAGDTFPDSAWSHLRTLAAAHATLGEAMGQCWVAHERDQAGASMQPKERRSNRRLRS